MYFLCVHIQLILGVHLETFQMVFFDHSTGSVSFVLIGQISCILSWQRIISQQLNFKFSLKRLSRYFSNRIVLSSLKQLNCVWIIWSVPHQKWLSKWGRKLKTLRQLVRVFCMIFLLYVKTLTIQVYLHDIMKN